MVALGLVVKLTDAASAGDPTRSPQGVRRQNRRQRWGPVCGNGLSMPVTSLTQEDIELQAAVDALMEKSWAATEDPRFSYWYLTSLSGD